MVALVPGWAPRCLVSLGALTTCLYSTLRGQVPLGEASGGWAQSTSHHGHWVSPPSLERGPYPHGLPR